MERMCCGVSHSSHNVISGSRLALSILASRHAERSPSHYSYCSEEDCVTAVGSRSPPAKSQSLLSIFDCFLDFFLSVPKVATAQMSKKNSIQTNLWYFWPVMLQKKVDRREKMLQVSVNLIQIAELLSCYTKKPKW